MENKIKFDERNYRKHSDQNKKIIKKSLQELGAGRSVVIDADDTLVAGNGVYEQAQKLKMPVEIRQRLSLYQRKEVLKKLDMKNFFGGQGRKIIITSII